VPYVSFVNGLLSLVISDLIKRQREKNPALHHLICPQKVLLTLGVLWLLRIPMSAAGMNLHAEAPGLVNWLLFASLLTMNIVLQFSYFAVRLAGSIENRGQLVEINRRLHALLSEHDKLVPKINSGFAALPAQMLSAQIAHELNQPLASLRLKLETLLSFPVARLDDAPMKSMVADIERISGIVRSLQHLVRGEDLDIRRHDLGTIFNSALGSLPGVEIVSPTGPLPVMMDAPLIASALKSLVHCLQAFAESSSNESGANFDVIATCDTAQDGLWAQIWLSAPGAHLDPNIITVLQSGKVLDPIGHAMPSHSIHQLINLLMVQYVMRAQRGQISIETRHGGPGTMAMLRIPIAALTSGRLPAVA
jgi:hypothetical protein